MKTFPTLLLAVAALSLASCQSGFRGKGSTKVSSKHPTTLTVTAKTPTRATIEIWNDGPDVVNILRTGKEETSAPMNEGAAYKYEHTDLETFEMHFESEGEATVRYVIEADDGLAVSFEAR